MDSNSFGWRSSGKTLMLAGYPNSAEQAANWELIWRVFDDQHLATEARKLTQHFATALTASLAMTKQAIHATLSNNLDQQLGLERDLQREVGELSDYAEGVSAFFREAVASIQGQIIDFS